MKIAILGGTFDPPHLGHLIVATAIKEYIHADQVWLMPVFSHAFHKHLSPAPHRLAMVSQLETEYVKASDFEIKRNETSYTIDTLQLLSHEYPQHDFSFCIGSDMLADFQKWKEWQTIVSDYNLVVYPRGFGIHNLYAEVKKAFNLDTIPENITIISGEHIVVTTISSSVIRSRLEHGKSIDYLVPAEIKDYIKEHQLYQKK